MRESKKKKKKKDGYDDILGLSYDKDMGKYTSYRTLLLLYVWKKIHHLILIILFFVLIVLKFGVNLLYYYTSVILNL